MTVPPRVRIAPSPTGDPHVGTAYVALFNSTFAESQGGTFLLRIDDTDRARYQESSETAIFKALRWLGFDWTEGPDVGGPHAPYRQSERTELYRERCRELLDSGSAYRCFCTSETLAEMRKAQEAQGQYPVYDRRCRDLSAAEIQAKVDAGEAHVLRLEVPRDGVTEFVDGLRGTITIQNSEIDDQVLMKSDGFPTYHMANCVDDIAMGITDVIRAEEWVTSTPKHVLIYQALGAPLPRFFHVPLLRNKDKSKISKRKNPVSLDHYREQGYLPEALRNFLARLGWCPPDEAEIFDHSHFREHFRLEDISLGAPIFDLEKLLWLNGMHIRKLSVEELGRRLLEGGFLGEVSLESALPILPIAGQRMQLLKDFADQSSWYFGDAGDYEAADLVPKKSTEEISRTALARTHEAILAQQDWSLEALESLLDTGIAEWGMKKPQLFMPLRMALTGRRDAPSVHELLHVLGQERVLLRIQAAIGKLGSA